MSWIVQSFRWILQWNDRNIHELQSNSLLIWSTCCDDWWKNRENFINSPLRKGVPLKRDSAWWTDLSRYDDSSDLGRIPGKISQQHNNTNSKMEKLVVDQSGWFFHQLFEISAAFNKFQFRVGTVFKTIARALVALKRKCKHKPSRYKTFVKQSRLIKINI